MFALMKQLFITYYLLLFITNCLLLLSGNLKLALVKLLDKGTG